MPSAKPLAAIFLPQVSGSPRIGPLVSTGRCPYAPVTGALLHPITAS